MNYENLKPFTSDQSRDEAARNGHKGGIASGEARRNQKRMREQMKFILSLPVKSVKAKAQLEALGIPVDELTNGTMFLVKLYNDAINGNTKAANLVMKITGELEEKLKVEIETPLTRSEAEKMLSSLEK